MENIEKYKEYTKSQNWSKIFDLNGIKIDTFGTKKELKVLSNYLEADEIVFALVSGVMSQTDTSNAFDFGTNTWLAALTSERILFLDHAMLSKSVDTQSVRHDRVQAVSASQGWLLGKVSIDIGNRSIIIDNCVKSDVSVFANLANKLLKEAQEKSSVPTSSEDDPLTQLEKLANLKASGVLSDDEFSTAKAKILAKM